jgi:hypothetical protein
MELSWHERRRKHLRVLKYRALSNKKSPKSEEFREQRLAARDPVLHYFIGSSTRSFIAMVDFSQRGRFSTDAACSVRYAVAALTILLTTKQTFVSSLKQHLLPRFIQLARPDLKDPALGAFVKSQDWSHLVLKNDRLYTHQILRLKYTTYDTRRDEDIIHLDTPQCNLMLHNPEYSYKSKNPKHPFRYCKVIAILHADVTYVGKLGPRLLTHHRLNFLWVRWYGVHPASSEFQLDRAKLLPLNERGSHSFIDPSLALRACHMIPRFRKGMKHPDGKGTSELANDGSDWIEYYINR